MEGKGGGSVEGKGGGSVEGKGGGSVEDGRPSGVIMIIGTSNCKTQDYDCREGVLTTGYSHKYAKHSECACRIFTLAVGYHSKYHSKRALCV
jgi:hypothetical protein